MEHKEEELKSKVRKSNLPAEEKNEFECSSCSCLNESSALFCEECGLSLSHIVKCPDCGTTAKPQGDICEICGTWLLKGQCRFCYEKVEEGQAFCGECGNPPSGIVCTQCGNLSNFDFCKSCNIPLSLQGKEMVKEAVTDPKIKKISSLFDSFPSDETALSGPENDVSSEAFAPQTDLKKHDEQVSQLKAYRESPQKPAVKKSVPPTSKALFSGDQKKSIGQLTEKIEQETERQRIEEEKRRREEEERRRIEAEERRRKKEEERRKEIERKKRMEQQFNEAMQQFSRKTFSTQQEARRFYMNLIASFPKEIQAKAKKNGLEWLCNAYGCFHPSPSSCARPSAGGVWMFR